MSPNGPQQPASPMHRDQVFAQVVSRAVTSPVSIFLSATGVLLVLSPVAWPLGVAALIGEAGWLWMRIRDPSQARATSEELLQRRWRDLVHRLEEISSSLDRETANALAAIVEAQERLMGLPRAEAVIQTNTRLELTSLLQHCLSLAEKRHHLLTHVASFNSQEIQRQAMQLQARLDGTPDPVTRGLYEQALDQKRQELENFVRLEEAIERIGGQLTVVQCTFHNILSRMVRLHSAETAATDDLCEPVAQELNQLTARVAALEASLDETLTLRGIV